MTKEKHFHGDKKFQVTHIAGGVRQVQMSIMNSATKQHFKTRANARSALSGSSLEQRNEKMSFKRNGGHSRIFSLQNILHEWNKIKKNLQCHTTVLTCYLYYIFCLYYTVNPRLSVPLPSAFCLTHWVGRIRHAWLYIYYIMLYTSIHTSIWYTLVHIYYMKPIHEILVISKFEIMYVANENTKNRLKIWSARNGIS